MQRRSWVIASVLLLGVAALGGQAFAGSGEEFSGVVNDTVVVEAKAPRVINSSRVSPSYPPAALAARFDATVTLAAQVLEDGTVGEVKVVETSRPNLGFEASAINAMKQWRFEPGSVDGEPIESISTVRLHFRTPQRGMGAGGPSVAGQFLMSNEMRVKTAAGDRRTLITGPLGMRTAGVENPQQPGDPRSRFSTNPGPSCKDPGCMYDRRQAYTPVPVRDNVYVPTPKPR